MIWSQLWFSWLPQVSLPTNSITESPYGKSMQKSNDGDSGAWSITGSPRDGDSGARTCPCIPGWTNCTSPGSEGCLGQGATWETHRNAGRLRVVGAKFENRQLHPSRWIYYLYCDCALWWLEPVVLKVMCNIYRIASHFTADVSSCVSYTLLFEIGPCHIAACCHYPSQDHEKEVDNRTVELEMLRERRTAVHEELQRLDELRAKEAEDYKAPTNAREKYSCCVLPSELKCILLVYTIFYTILYYSLLFYIYILFHTIIHYSIGFYITTILWFYDALKRCIFWATPSLGLTFASQSAVCHSGYALSMDRCLWHGLPPQASKGG